MVDCTQHDLAKVGIHEHKTIHDHTNHYSDEQDSAWRQVESDLVGVRLLLDCVNSLLFAISGHGCILPVAVFFWQARPAIPSQSA